MVVMPLSKCCMIMSTSSNTASSLECSFLNTLLAATIYIIDMKIIMDLVKNYSLKYL